MEYQANGHQCCGLWLPSMLPRTLPSLPLPKGFLLFLLTGICVFSDGVHEKEMKKNC